METNVSQFNSETSKDELDRKIMSVFDDIFKLQSLADDIYEDEQVLSESADTRKLKFHLRKLKNSIRNLDFDYVYLTSYISEHYSQHQI